MKTHILWTVKTVLLFLVAYPVFASGGILDRVLIPDKQTAEFVGSTSMSSEEMMLSLQEWAWYRHMILNFELDQSDQGRRMFDLKHQTLESFLQKDFLKYSVEIHDKIINVFPSSTRNDPNYVMNLKVPLFKAKNEDRFQIFVKLVNELHKLYPDKVDIVPGPLLKLDTAKADNRSGIKLTPISFEVSDKTVRQILNKISFEENAFWAAGHAGIDDSNLLVKFSSEDHPGIYNGTLTLSDWITGKKPPIIIINKNHRVGDDNGDDNEDDDGGQQHKHH